jgi:RNA polymerase sigma-70 factor (ECF subfamily)
MLPRAAVTLVAAARVTYRPELFPSPYVTPTVEPEPKRWCAADEEDVRLMCRAREGEIDAFSLLFDRHRERLVSFLFRLFGDREQAEDGAQEVFLRLWLARGRYQPRARFTTFLFQVAHNYWLDQRRKAGARPIELELAEGVEGGSTGRALRAPAATEPHYQLFLRYRQWQIQQAIARLPETHRAVFVLVHLEGRRLTEVAEILAIPVGTVKSRMHAAIRLLRGRLGSVDGEEGE